MPCVEARYLPICWYLARRLLIAITLNNDHHQLQKRNTSYCFLVWSGAVRCCLPLMHEAGYPQFLQHDHGHGRVIRQRRLFRLRCHLQLWLGFEPCRSISRNVRTTSGPGSTRSLRHRYPVPGGYPEMDARFRGQDKTEEQLSGSTHRESLCRRRVRYLWRRVRIS